MFSPFVVSLQILLLAYHQLTTLVDFYPFNNVRQYSLRERLRECLIHGLLMTLSPLGFVLDIGWLKIVGAVYYGVLLIGGFLSWWRPYIGGATPDWQATYDRIFRQTLIVLPPIRNHPVPNLEHVILHSLTLLTAVLTWLTMSR